MDAVRFSCLYRSSLGVQGLGVHHHGASIIGAGFSLQKCSDVVAFECPPAPFDEEVIKANKELVDLAGGYIPACEAIRLVAIGGNHTNTFLRCVKAGVKTQVESLQDANGKLDAMHTGANEPIFLKTVEEGITWLILDWRLLHILYV